MKPMHRKLLALALALTSACAAMSHRRDNSEDETPAARVAAPTEGPSNAEADADSTARSYSNSIASTAQTARPAKKKLAQSTTRPAAEEAEREDEFQGRSSTPAYQPPPPPSPAPSVSLNPVTQSQPDASPEPVERDRRWLDTPTPDNGRARPTPQPLATTPVLRQTPPAYSDAYFHHFGVNPTYETRDRDTSTFATDVDTAAYTLARGYIDRGSLPPDAAVRVEEFVNAFDYGYKAPEKDAIALSAEVFPSPYRRGYHLLQIGLKAKELEEDERRALHLVFVIDVSGSMETDNRIGLVRDSVKTLVRHLSERDTVAIVSFNERSHVELEPTSATDMARIFRALDGLTPGGSTNVEQGLRLGYRLAANRLEDGGTHRVMLLSDGVANEGITEADGIFDTVRNYVAQGITVTTVGVGMSNFNDVLLNRFAQVGKGNYFFMDGPEAARKVFVEQRLGTLEPIANDLKVQVVFDPRTVTRYRLLGYESRALKKRDFEDDRVTGGEVGAGHAVTALYEIKLARTDASLGHVRFRCKTPGGWWPETVDRDLPAKIIRAHWDEASPPARLAVVAASFAEKLRGSYWARTLSWERLNQLWGEIGEPLQLRRDVNELGQLIREAGSLDRRGDPFERDLPVADMDFDRLPVLR